MHPTLIIMLPFLCCSNIKPLTRCVELMLWLLSHVSEPVGVIPKNYSPVESVMVLGLPQGLRHVALATVPV